MATEKKSQRRKWWDRMLGGAVCTVFIYGLYAIAHYGLGADDHLLLCLAGGLIWSDMTTYINKPDVEASE